MRTASNIKRTVSIKHKAESEATPKRTCERAHSPQARSADLTTLSRMHNTNLLAYSRHRGNKRHGHGSHRSGR